MVDSVTVTDNRTGRSLEIPIKGGGIPSSAWAKLLPGVWFFDPGLTSTSMAASAISYLNSEEGVLRYRGYPIEQLAEQSTYLEVAYLLLNGELPNSTEYIDWVRNVTHHTFIPENFRKRFLESFHYDAHPMGILVSAIAALSTFYGDITETRERQVVQLIAKMPTLAAAAHRFSVGMPFVYPDNQLPFPANFLSMMRKIGEPQYQAEPALIRAIDVLLILYAEHDQDCSTTVMRTAGSAHSDLYSSTAAACATLYGRRLGGANEEVVKMLAAIGTIDNVKPFIKSVKESNGTQKLKGFGHSVYKNYDPRARVIKEVAYKVFEVTGKNPLLDIALKLEEVALSDKYFIVRKLCPNVDFYSSLIYQAMGFPIEMFPVLFAIPRVSGWLAHYVELLDQDSRIVRPRQIYTGENERKYIKLNQRPHITTRPTDEN